MKKTHKNKGLSACSGFVSGVILFGLSLSVVTAKAQDSAVSTVSIAGEFIGGTVLRGQDKPRFVAFSAKGQWLEKKRFAEVFRMSDGKLLRESFHQLWDDVAAYDICSVGGVDRLVFLRANGVYEFLQSKPWLEQETIFQHFREDALPRVRVCLFESEQQSLMLIPEISGVAKWVLRPPKDSRGAPQVEHTGNIRLQARLNFYGSPRPGEGEFETQRVFLGMQFPDTTVVDFDGDGVLDICQITRSQVKCDFKAGDPQSKGSDFETREFVFRVLSEAEEKESGWRVQGRILDVNNDGKSDVIIQKSRFSVTSMSTEVRIYRQSKTGSFGTTPDQTLKRDGFFHVLDFRDLDADGWLDLVAPLVELAWTDLTGIVITGSTDIEFGFFRNDKGKFRDPVILQEISYPVDFKNFAAIQGSLPIWRQQFVRKPSAVFFPEGESIEIYPWVDSKLGEEPLFKIGTTVGGAKWSIDFDQDGTDEILLAFPDDQKLASKITLVRPSLR